MNLFENIEKLINSRDIENEVSREEIKSKDNNISQDEIELANKLDAVESFTVDRIEENIVVLEDRKTNKMYDIEKNMLPEEIKPGDIIKKVNGKFFVDEIETQEVEERIQKKMNDLWN